MSALADVSFCDIPECWNCRICLNLETGLDLIRVRRENEMDALVDASLVVHRKILLLEERILPVDEEVGEVWVEVALHQTSVPLNCHDGNRFESRNPSASDRILVAAVWRNTAKWKVVVHGTWPWPGT